MKKSKFKKSENSLSKDDLIALKDVREAMKEVEEALKSPKGLDSLLTPEEVFGDIE